MIAYNGSCLLILWERLGDKKVTRHRFSLTLSKKKKLKSKTRKFSIKDFMKRRKKKKGEKLRIMN